MVQLSSLIKISFILIVAISCGTTVEGFFCSIFTKYPPKTNILEIILDVLGVKSVKYYLYTNNNPDSVQIPDKESKLKSLDFDPHRKTFILIHGFLSDNRTPWVKTTVKKLLEKEDMNVIVVDWSKIFLKSKYNYAASAAKTEYIAEGLSTLLQQLSRVFETKISDWKYIHFLGHSLGAHMAGQTSKNLQSEKFSVHRITALDPARPYFEDTGAHLQLNKNYAKFVDVIHTNSHQNHKTLGMYKPIGHIDFYPNGGDWQPQCRLRRARTITDGPISECLSDIVFGIDGHELYSNYMSRKKLNDDMICDHTKGEDYFIESLDGQFLAYKMELSNMQNLNNKCVFRNCNETKCVEMGYNAVKYDNPEYYGTYYLDVPNCS